MAKTTGIFRAVMLALVLVPLIGATNMEELERRNEKLEVEFAQLKEMLSALQVQMEAKVDSVDFTAQMEMNVRDFTAQMKKKVGVDDFTAQLKMKIDVDDFNVKFNDTEELEARVSVLEESVADLEVDVLALADDMDNVESVNILQDETVNILEAEIFDNQNDIEELVDITTGLTTQVSNLEEDVVGLDQRVGDLESGGGGGGNVTDLEERVETLEEVTSQLTDDVSSLQDSDVTQDEIISGLEEDVTSLDQRVEDLESGGGGGNTTDYNDSIFMAALSTTQTTNQDPLIFENDVINHGGHYSSTTGKYTVPYDGIYQFSVHLTAHNSIGVYFYIEIDDSNNDSHSDLWIDEVVSSTTILLELAAGQTVHVRMHHAARGSSSYFYTYFSGFLVSPN